MTPKNSAAAQLLLAAGKSEHALKPGQAHVFAVRPGEHYRIVKAQPGPDKLLDSVVGKRVGNDLELRYADGTQVKLAEYFKVCAGPNPCALKLTDELGRVHTIDGAAAGAPVGDGSTLVYAAGDADTLLALAKGEPGLRSLVAGLGGESVAYHAATPAATPAAASNGGLGMLGLAAGGLGLAAAAGGGGGGGGGAAPAAASGTGSTPTPVTPAPGGGSGAANAPTVVALALQTPAGGTAGPLAPGEVVRVAVTMSENTTVSGSPLLALQIGGQTVEASYLSGSGSKTLMFSYTVQPGQTDLDGISIPANALKANGGQLTNAAGASATLQHGVIAADPAFMVDTAAPAASVDAASTVVTPGSTVTARSSEAGTLYLVHNSIVVSNLASMTTAPDSKWNSAPANANADAALATVGLVDGAYRVFAADTAGNLSAPAGQVTLDGNRPAITSVALSGASGAPAGVLNTGDVVTATLKLSEAVTVTGSPTLTLRIGNATVQAGYASGSGQELHFTYTILAGQADGGGIGIPANSLALNGATILDSAGNAIVATHPAVADNPQYKVDTSAPEVASVAIASATGLQNGALNAGDTVTLAVTLREAVDVSGTPQLAVQVGSSTVIADYVAGSGSATLHFRLPISAGQADSDGIAVAANSLSLNGGAIRDAAGHDALLTHAALAANPGYKVETSAPEVQQVAVKSANGMTGGALSAGDVVSVAVNLSEAVVVSGKPELTLQVGAAHVQAQYASGSGTSVLIFQYTILPGQSATGLAIPASSIGLNGGQIADRAGNAALLGHAAVALDTGYPVNTTVPAITGVMIDAASGASNGVLNTGDVVTVLLKSDQALTVTGVPQLALNIGGATAQARYVSGSGTTELSFQYTIQAGQNDPNGISLPANGLGLNGGKITNQFGGELPPSYGAVGDHPLYRVETTAPIIKLTAATIANTGKTQVQSSEAGTIYLVHESLLDKVDKTDLASITGQAGNKWNSVAVQAGVSTDITATGLVVGNYRAIAVDAAGNLSESSPQVLKIDSAAPMVASVALAQGTGAVASTYNAGDQLAVDVVMTGQVSVTGVPTIGLQVGGAVVQAQFSHLGADGKTLTFRYTVAAGLNDADGVAVIKDSLALGGGAIQDLAGNPASLEHDAANGDQHRVDTMAPKPTLTAGVVAPSSGATVSSSEAGTAYLVHKDYAAGVSKLSDISGALGVPNDRWNSVALGAANSPTTLSMEGLADGEYVLFTVDAAENLSQATTTTVVMDGTGPKPTLQTKGPVNSSASVAVKSPEAGTVYLVWVAQPSGAGQAPAIDSVDDIHSLADRDSWTFVKVGANVEATVSAANLKDGTYRIYAADNLRNLDHGDTIVIENTAPTPNIVVNNANVSSATSSAATIDLRMNEKGTLYLVPAATSVPNAAALKALTGDQVVKVDTDGNTAQQVNVSSLPTGAYHVYAIDAAGNLSTTVVTLTRTASGSGSGGGGKVGNTPPVDPAALPDWDSVFAPPGLFDSPAPAAAAPMPVTAVGYVEPPNLALSGWLAVHEAAPPL